MGESPKQSWGASIATWFALQVAGKAVGLALGTPAVMAAVIGALIYLDELPLGVVFLSMLVAAAATSVLLNNGRTFMLAHRVDGKLRFEAADIAGVRRDDGRSGYGISLLAVNRSDAPIQYEVTKRHGHANERVAICDGENGPVDVQSGAPSSFAVAFVPFDEPVKSSFLNGEVEISYIYGRPGKMKHMATQRFNVRAQTDPHGNVMMQNSKALGG